MARKGFKRRFPPLEILTKEQVEQIKIATLDILKETGMTVQHKEALKLLEQNDCIVDYETMRVRYPEGLVEECLRRCPSSFRVKARDTKDDLILGGNTVYFMSDGALNLVDLETWEPYLASEQEYIDAIRVYDAIPNHDWTGAYTPCFGYKGVPEVLKMTMGLVIKMKYSTKFTVEGDANYNWKFNFRIAKAAGTEMTTPSLQVSSPLTQSHDGVECIFDELEYGFPTGVDTGPLLGATAPATIAGALAEFNAELIAGIVLIQLKKPYSRVFVWGFPNPQNMRTGYPNFGNITNSLLNVANNQIWRDYGVPIRNTACLFTNSKKIDFQSGVEKAIPAILAGASGANVIHLHGSLYGEYTSAVEQAVLDDDLAGIVGRFLEGVDVNDETVALDLIHSVGPVPGHFLDTKHTLKWWNKEQYNPECFDDMSYPEWIKSGKKDCIYYAKERVKKILSEHEVSIKLTKDQENEINEIVKEAESFYKERGEI